MNWLTTLLVFRWIVIPDVSNGFVPLVHQHKRRIASAYRPFFSTTTELKSDETSDPAAPSVSSDTNDSGDADKVVAEAVTEAIDEIAEEEKKSAEDDEDGGDKKSKKRVLRVRHTVFIGNLPFELTDKEIGDLCTDYGKVLTVTVPKRRDTGQPRGFAFVDMSTKEEMENAIQGIDGSNFEGRRLRASESDPGQKQEKKQNAPVVDDGTAKIYVGNLPFDTNRDELLDFYKSFVDASEVYIPLNADTGTGRGFAFVTVDAEAVESAIEQTNGMEFNGRPLVVSKPLPPGQRANRRPSIRDRTKLYVGNLAFTTDVEILEEVFSEFGDVLDCYMPEDPSRGGSRGFGFVTMGRENALEAIAELDGCELDGRFIRVNEAMPKGKADEDEGFGDDDFDA